MKDIERELKQCELAAPSADLGRRIEQLFAQAPAPRWRFLTRPIALWQCAAACLLFAVLGYWCQGRRTEPEWAPPATPTTVYIIQPGATLPENAFYGPKKRTEGLNGPLESHITYPAEPEGDSKQEGSRV